MLSEDQQLEAWWQTLSDEQRAAVLEADPDDIPGWIIASAVAAHADLAADTESEGVEHLAAHAPQALQRFIAAKRAS